MLGALFSSSAWAGNAVLMQEKAKELVSVNEQAIKELPGIQDNSRIKLEADIVRRDGKTEVHVQRLSIIPEPNAKITPANTKVRKRHIQPPVTSGRIETGGGASVATKSNALTNEDVIAKVDELSVAHPSLHFVELSGAEAKAMNLESGGKPKKVFAAFWDE